MNEGKITAIFGIVAAVALGLAWWSKPEAASSVQEVAGEQIGQNVFPKFEDPGVASTMQIVKYDDTLAQLKRFEVSRDNDTKLWTLPSHDGYPADAADQVKNATTPLIGLEILDVVAETAGDHELYGVVNPDDGDLAAGASGVGMLVRFKDDADQVLASLVIGKEVEKAEGQRYVRVPTEDAVYQVEISTDAFTTNFKDWIEGELLGVRSMDITKVAVRDYSLNQGLGSVTLARNFDAEANYDAASSNWNLTKLVSYESGQPQPVALEEGESVNKQFLNNLRTAVQDLEIVDVQRKPTGLAADLKVDDALLKNNESIAALQQQGFFAAAINNETEIFAAGGETIVGTEEGVDYLLRFGEATASLASMESEDEDAGLSRYLLVTARLDESQFPAPELEPLPETVEEMLARERGDSASAGDDAAMQESEDTNSSGQATPDPASSDSSSAEEPSGETPSTESSKSDTPEPEKPQTSEPQTEAPQTEEPQTEEPTPDAPKSEESTSSESSKTEPESTETKKSEPANDDPEEDDVDECGPFSQESSSADDQDATEEDDAPAQDASSEEEPSSQEDADADSSTEASNAPAQEPEETEEELKERLEAVRDEIAKANQRKIDERSDRIEKARKKVLELNARFSEWYYVVGDSAYKKLKITREDLIEKAGEEEATLPAGLEGLNLNGAPGLQGLPSPLPQQ